MCTLTLGWKILILITFTLYSVVMIGVGMVIEANKARGNNEKVSVNLKNAAAIIFTACVFLWLFLL